MGPDLVNEGSEVLTAETVPTTATPLDRLSGSILLFCVALHVAACIVDGAWFDVLWACQVAAVCLGIGMVLPNANLAGIGSMCLMVGTPLWLVDVGFGAELVPTSGLTHALGWWLSVDQLRRPRVVKGIWWKTVAALACLQLFCRMVTPSDRNINAAFDTYSSVASYFPHHAYYLASLLVAATGIFWLVERITRRNGCL